ncbi:MAG TPA: WD40 repeat domain-containing protein [Pyrinomonadaceae bacterium]|jgi:WD40 repeat protein/energy-coupling factor transporter ATP-binding protein EcfA2
MSERNPFPGLRPFEFDEYELFFGREEQYEQMVGRLSEMRFLAVVGTSGSGKSSLVKAGLLPALYGGMMSAGPDWRVALFRPKEDPIRELALALNHRRVFGDRSKENGSSQFKMTEAIDWQSLCSRLSAEAREQSHNPGGRVLEVLPVEKRDVILKVARGRTVEEGKSDFVQTFNEVLKQRNFYQARDFERIQIKGDAKVLLSRGQNNLSDLEIEKLNRLILEAAYPQEIAKNGEIQAQITEVTLRRGDLGLVEAAREANMSTGENLLVVVDQFEELFRYARISEMSAHGNQAAAFVKLLLAARSQREIPIYVVLTMRSDYLGDCAAFWDLPEAINEGQYLIPRLTRDQRREAIRGPIQVRGADITPQLVNKLLNDMGDNPDQLPILQHALMRTWDNWEKDKSENEPISTRHYEAIGAMAEALSRHADEAFADLKTKRNQEIAEKLFKCLTEKGAGDRETRRPTELRDIRAITEGKIKEIVGVIDVFRQDDRSFLMPPSKKPLKRETSIDVSHESLIRNWTKLSEWVEQEARSANIYRRLVETARLHKEDQAGLLTPLEVDYALKWLEREKPNVVWASRYHCNLEVRSKDHDEATSDKPRKVRDQEIFEGAMAFLEESRIEHEKALKLEEKMRRKEVRQGQIRKFAAILTVAFVVLMMAAGVIFWQWRDVRKANKVKAHLTYGAEMNLAQREFEDRNFAKVNHLLQDPNDILAQDTSLRGFEWYHLWLLSHNERMTVSKQDSAVLSVAFPNNSNILATGKGNGTVELADLKTGERLATLGGKSANVSTVGISPNGRRIGVGRKDGSVELWTISDDLKRTTLQSELVKQQTADSPPVVSLTFSPDSRLLAVGIQNGVVRLWDTTSGKEISQAAAVSTIDAKPDTAPASSIAFSPDGKSLAIGRTGKVMLVDPSSGRERFTAQLEERAISEPVPINALAFSADGEILVMGRADSTIVLWDLVENKYLLTLVGHSMEVLTVAFSKEGILASGSGDGSIKLWNLESLFDSDYRRYLIGRNSSREKPSKLMSRARLNTEKAIETANVQREFRNEVSKNLLIGSLNGHAGPVKTVAFMPDCKSFVSGSQDGTVLLWAATIDSAIKATVRLGWQSTHGLSSLAFSRDGKMLATGSYDGSAEIWNTETKLSDADKGKQLQGRGSPKVSAVAFSPDAQTLATGSWDKNVTLWEVSTRRKLAELSGHSKSVLSIAFSPNGKILATGSADKTVRLWDVNTRQLLKQMEQPSPVLSIAFSPDGTTLAIGMADTTVRLWDMNGDKEAGRLKGHTDAVSSVAFSPDGLTVATGSWDTTAKLWDSRTSLELTTLEGHSQAVLSVSFSPNGARLATGSQDGGVKLWDTSYELGDKNTRHALVTLKGQEGVSLVAAVSVAFKPGDGNILAIGNGDGTVLLRYAATPNEVFAQQKSLLNK